jgi:hypothetical protein
MLLTNLTGCRMRVHFSIECDQKPWAASGRGRRTARR